MAKSKNDKTEQSAKQGAPGDVDPGEHEAVQQACYFATSVDPTPNGHYTVAGNDLPVPETDPDWAKQVQAKAAALGS